MKYTFFSFLFSMSIVVLFPGIVSAAPREELFEVTAYYSPQAGQSAYVHGDYETDQLINGLGFMSASGASPYEGMVAAPQGMSFGTLLYVEGRGWHMVDDRGGVIEGKDENKRISRLDIWTGRGDYGRKTAMNWGRRQRSVTVFSDDFKDMPLHMFSRDIDFDMTTDDVKHLQGYLKGLGFLNHAVTGWYGPITQQAVLDFQLWKEIVPDSSYTGAGRVGPGTRMRLNNITTAVQALRDQKSYAYSAFPPHQQNQQLIDSFYSTALSSGDSNYYVFMLQSRLDRLGYFDHPHTTFDFGEKTTQALLSFQLAAGVISSADQFGAGQFGPATRAKLRKALLF